MIAVDVAFAVAVAVAVAFVVAVAVAFVVAVAVDNEVFFPKNQNETNFLQAQFCAFTSAQTFAFSN